MSMDNRKRQVLQAVVRLYGSEGEPVGSTLLAQHFSMSVSSATLRSEMAALTKLGLLEQPHTSAGRIPSAKGYRYYIDNLMDVEKAITSMEQAQIQSVFKEMDFDPEHLAQDAAKALAHFTGYAAAVTTPESDEACIAHYEVVRVGLYTAAVLAITNAGGVSTRTAKFSGAVNNANLKALADVLNKYFTFLNPQDISDSIISEALKELNDSKTILSSGLAAGIKLLSNCSKQSIFLEGDQNLLRRFGGTDVINLMSLFADEQAAKECLSTQPQHTAILLGEDIQRYPMPNLCIVKKQYVAGGGLTGTIAIIGPTRMQFKKLLPLLDYFSQILGQCMSGKSEEEIFI